MKHEFKESGIALLVISTVVMTGTSRLASGASAGVVTLTETNEAFTSLVDAGYISNHENGSVVIRVPAATPSSSSGTHADKTPGSPSTSNVTEFSVTQLVELAASGGMLSGNPASTLTITPDTEGGRVVVTISYN